MIGNDSLCREILYKELESIVYFYNETYSREPHVFKYLTNHDYLKITVYILIIFGGLVGNISIILIVCLIRSMRTTINYYIANLAVADAFICIFCMIPHVIHTMTLPAVFALGEFMCKFNPYTQMACLTCSVLTLSAISCDRFVAIIYPLRVRITKQRPYIVMTFIWIISLCVSIPFLIVKKHVVFHFTNFEETRCRDDWPIDSYWNDEIKLCVNYHLFRVPFYLSVSIILYFIPIIIMICAYSLILRKLWKSEVLGEQLTQNANVQERARRKVIKLVFVVLLAFILCWTPLQVLVLIITFPEKFKYTERFAEFRWFAYFLAYANSFINPFIYGGFNKTFRDSYLLLLQCKCRMKGYNRPVRSRLTFTTGFTSSLSRFTTRFFHSTSQKSNNVMIVPVANIELKDCHL